MTRRLLALIAAMSTSGCLVLTLQPAYDDESVVFDERLLGQWENADDRTAATIERGEWRSYKVTYVAGSTTTPFHANLTKIGALRFLDLTQPRGSDAGPYLMPVHALYRIELGEKALTAASLDYTWFARTMPPTALGRLTVAFDQRRNVLVTSATGELRAWLARAPEEAFAVPVTYVRKGAQ